MRKLILASLACLALAGCIVIEPAGSKATSTDQFLSDNPVGAALNRERAAVGLAPLRRSTLLSQAAQRHAQDMVANGFFAHTGSDGSENMDRIRATGYGGCFFSENLIAGPNTPQDAMAGWMDSAPHRGNALSPKPTDYGIAQVGDRWVMNFGAQCKSIPGGISL